MIGILLRKSNLSLVARYKIVAKFCLTMVVLLIFMGAVASQKASANSLSVGGGTLSWSVSTSTSVCNNEAFDTYTAYQFSRFSFKSSTGVVTSLSGSAAYLQWSNGTTCGSGVPNGASPSSITLTGSTFVITFVPQSGGSGSATYTTTQTISFTAPTTPVTYGVSPITLLATASSGLAVTFSVVSGPATVSGSTLTITGVGTVVVAANQAGNSTYAAAPQVTQSITVNKATLTITCW